MNKCVSCGHQGLLDETASDSIKVGTLVVDAVLPAQVCPECQEAYFTHATIRRFELQVAAQLARDGSKTPEAFVFMRKALGMRSVELADLLDVSPETVSRWEHEKVALDHRSVALLAAMVLDDLEGHTRTIERLRALKQNHDAPRTVRLGLLPEHA